MLIFLVALGIFAYGLRFHFVQREPHWTRRYGVELPISTLRFTRLYYVLRTRYEDMSYYRLMYYNPDARIDPLSDDIMDPAQFRMYKGKRVLRFQRYMRRRDKSFDFMIIGESPWELVDDDL